MGSGPTTDMHLTAPECNRQQAAWRPNNHPRH